MVQKKGSAQLQREIDEALARRPGQSAAETVKKLLSSARHLVNKQREGYNGLRETTRTVGRLHEIAGDAITAGELTIAATVPPRDSFWADRLDAEVGHARQQLAELQALRNDSAGYARTASQRFSADTSVGLATALYYLSSLKGLAIALRKIESVAGHGVLLR